MSTVEDLTRDRALDYPRRRHRAQQPWTSRAGDLPRSDVHAITEAGCEAKRTRATSEPRIVQRVAQAMSYLDLILVSVATGVWMNVLVRLAVMAR